MTPINHKQAHLLLQQETRTAAEERALHDHLVGCSDCRTYAHMHQQLQQALVLTIPVPELNLVEIDKLTAAMKRAARSKQQVKAIAAVFRPVLAGALALALLVWGLTLFARQPAPPEPAAALVAVDATATPTPEPTATPAPTATPEPTVIALEELIEVDLQAAEPRPHPQINGSRFILTLEQAQQEIAFPLRTLSLLPDGFVFAGADVTDGAVSQLFVLEGVSPSPVLALHQRQGPLSTPGRDDQQDAEGVTIQPVAGIGDGGLHYVDALRGMTALSWTEEGIAYNLQLSGAIWPLERLQALAQSLQPLFDPEPASP